MNIWLLVAAVIVCVTGLIVTLMIGMSKSNKEENSGYFQNVGKKWMRFSWIYLIGTALIITIFIFLLNRN